MEKKTNQKWVHSRLTGGRARWYRYGATVLVDIPGHTCGYSVHLPHGMGMYMYAFGPPHILHDMSVPVVGGVDIADDMSTSVIGPLYILRWQVPFWLVLKYGHAECTEYNYLTHFQLVEYTHLHRPYCNLSPPLRWPSRPPHQGILMQASVNTDSCVNFMVLWGVMLCILAHRYEHFRGTCCFCFQGNQASHNRKTELSITPLWKLKSQIMIYRVIQNDWRGFNNLSYTIHLR